MTTHFTLSRQLIPLMGFVILLWLSFLVLREFLLTLAWAFIIAYVFYPLYQFVTRYFNGNAVLSAALLTGAMTTFIIVLAYGLLTLLQDEMAQAYALLLTNFNQPTWELPPSIRNVPHIGNYLQTTLNRFLQNRTALNAHLIEWAKYGLGESAQFLRSFGQHLIKLCFVLITVFFCFRDGENWLKQLQLGARYFLNDTDGVYLQTAGDTSRAVVYGLVLAAFGQGVVAGFGYAVAGVSTPVLLGALTALLALIPMGATLIWLPTALILLINDELLAGFGLLAWGFLAISTVDNVIRPLVICGASETPFLVVLFGVFGGLTAFGAIGLFLGPVILALLLMVWRVNFKRYS